MKHLQHIQRILPVAMIFLAASSVAQESRLNHGRVSFDAEGTLIMGKDDADWSNATLNTLILPGDTVWAEQARLAELELASGTYLRMADRAKVEVVSIMPDICLQGWTGSFYVHRLSESARNCTLETPATNVVVAPGSIVRIDIEAGGGTTVYVVEGSAAIGIGTDHQQSVGSGLQVYIDPGHSGSQALRFDALNDDFDVWNRERVTLVVQGFLDCAEHLGGEQRALGVSDLSSSGRWLTVAGEQCWQPDPALRYVPYRDGYWSSVSGCGDVWVGRHAFEYTTCHYGRWDYVEQHGWLWHFDAEWSPAWVASVKYGPSLVWSPLGRDNLPVRIGVGATFNVGSVAFSLGACSFVPVDRVYFGYQYVQPAQIGIVERIEQRDIQIWNIDVNNIIVGKINGNWKGYGLYHGKPDKKLRGLIGVGGGRPTARDSVVVLNQSITTSIDFNSRVAVSGAASALPPGHAKRAVRLDAQAKLVKATMGPGKGKENGGEKGGPPEKAKGPDKGSVAEKAKGPEKSGAADKGKGPGKDGPPEKGKGSANGGAPGKGKGAEKGAAPVKAKGKEQGGGKGGGKEKGGGSSGKGK